VAQSAAAAAAVTCGRPRLALHADIDAVVALDRACSPVLSAAACASLIDGGGWLWVTGIDDDLWGFAAWRQLSDEAELLNLAVDPQRRRRGVARTLLDASLTQLVGAGIVRLLLDVRAGNLPARRLYESLGFDEDGRRRGYYPARGELPAEDAVLMSRNLEGPAA
jgi:ribosomal-protein-alanine N-acetyltransferase